MILKVRGMVVNQLQAHELAIPIVLCPQPQLLLRMIERFERDIRKALTKRLTKAKGITEPAADLIYDQSIIPDRVSSNKERRRIKALILRRKFGP